MLVPLLLLLGLLITGSFGPGWWLVRRLRWSLTERFVAAVAASGIVLYLAAFALYGLAAPRAAYWAVSAVGVGLGLAAWRDVRRLLRDRAMRRLLGGFGLLFIWMLLLLAIMRWMVCSATNFAMPRCTGDRCRKRRQSTATWQSVCW